MPHCQGALRPTAVAEKRQDDVLGRAKVSKRIAAGLEGDDGCRQAVIYHSASVRMSSNYAPMKKKVTICSVQATL